MGASDRRPPAARAGASIPPGDEKRPLMRTIHWLFIVSVALFVSSIGFVIAAGRMGREAPPPEGPTLTPVASVKHIMNGIVQPAASTIYNAVSYTSTLEGIQDKRPETEEEWAEVENSAAALVESGNLLLLGSRALDKGEWITMSQAMIDAGMVALKAAQAKDAEGLLASGENINLSCENCHQQYLRSGS